jgi:hypothetical protein
MMATCCGVQGETEETIAFQITAANRKDNMLANRVVGKR